jgi:hypothetical protein
MSSLTEHEPDHLNPNDPNYYAPRWLRDRAGPRSDTARESVRSPLPAPASLDSQLENAVASALWRPLDPEIIHEPPGLAEEDRRAALTTVFVRFAAAVGVSAIAALFFVIMVPASRQADSGATASAFLRSIKAALLQSGRRDEGSKPAVAEFQPILASAQSSQGATHEQSEQLLQQFLQWRQKPNSTETSP